MFDPVEGLIEQLQKQIPGVQYSPMVKNIKPYRCFRPICKSSFINLNFYTSKIKFWSDTHFYHSNIIKYCNRPFSSIEEMNSILVENYVNSVEQDDIVIWVGDVGMESEFKMNEQIFSKLPGYKILVTGNHDFKNDKVKKYDFDEIHLVLTIENFIISHHPWWDIPDGWYNIHGHLHHRHTNNPKHFNVSVEVINYKPITFEQIKQRLSVL